MKKKKIYSADKIFTGTCWLKEHALVVENDIVENIIPVGDIPADVPVEKLQDLTIAPAFIDLQIYGAYGRLFSVYPEIDTLHKLNSYCRSGGAACFLPTVATNSYSVFYRCIDAVCNYWNEGGNGVLGIHLEGPWINTLKHGAHIESFIHSPSMAQVKELITYGKDVIKMITLAPEVCSDEVTEYLLANNITISAGHSNCSYETAKKGFEKGISSVTHLYNAMSALQHRAPGLVGAVMDDEKVMASIIPDGYHVDFAAIRIAKEVMKERLFVITDAVTETDKGPYPHYLAGDKYEASGILSGSALTMGKAVQNLVSRAGIELGEAIRMCSLYPARLIGLDKKLGKIEKGYDATFVLMDKNAAVVKLLE